ncbi:MAG: polysaccharide deacetylase family protein [Mycobacterium sp.]
MTGHKPITYAGTELNRRHFLAGLSVATLVGVGLARCTVDVQPRVAEAATNSLPSVGATRIPLPGGGALSSIPGGGDLLALTLDDGVNTNVVRAYTQFAKDTGVRLTYFVNGRYASWTDNRDLLHPLVEAGQIQLGNHTWSHPDLATLPKDQVVEQLRRNHQFLMKTYGVDPRPYYRPPYGSHNPTVDAVAADLGYSVPTMWCGSLEDQNVIPESEIVKMANKYFNPQAIVIGHLNHLPVTRVYDQLLDVIRSRDLRTVTLNDVFAKPGQTA